MRAAASGQRARWTESGTTFECKKNKSRCDEAQPLQAAFDRAAQGRLDLGRRQFAEIAFAGDPHAIGQPAVECRADHLLGLAVAIARREVKEVDAGCDRGVHGCDAFLKGGLAPDLAQTAAAQTQCRDRP